MENKYILNNLDCPHCAQKIEDRLNKRQDINECRLAFAQRLLIIDSPEAIALESLLSDIQSIEPDVTISLKQKKHHHDHDHCCDHEHHHDHDHCCDHEHHHDHDHCCDHEHHHDHDCCCGHDHCSSEVKPERTIDSQKAIQYMIEGLDCASCAAKVEDAICKMDIVEDASLHFSTSVLQVIPQASVDHVVLLSELQKLVDDLEPGVVVSEKNNQSKIQKPVLFKWRENLNLIIGFVIYCLGFFVSQPQMQFVIFLVAYIAIGYEVVYKACRNIFRGEVFDENFLMVIATFGAFCIGEYGEAVAVMLFYSIGEIFQAYAVNKTRASISTLMDIKSEYANLKTSNGLQRVDPEALEIHDMIVVKVGEKVPVDGIVRKGHSTLDTSSLTGESLPRNVGENDEILAGVINLSELLEIEVTHVYDDSTVAKILELMENAASKKAPIERFISKFAKVYTPTVVILAAILAVVPAFIFKDTLWTDWLYRALTFLVVSCPCALVISIPLGLYAGLGKASQVGALIKGGNYLELLKDVDTVVFDKTGTLTHGQFEVVELNGTDELLKYGAYGEYLSNHPIAKSIVRKYGQHIDDSLLSNFQEVAGKGIEVDFEGQHMILGNQAFLESHDISIVEPDTYGTIVYIALNNEYLGSIVVSDIVKESAKKGIALLKEIGVRHTVMLTGDHAPVAKHIASQVGVDQVYSDLLPQDKVTQLEKILNDNQCVAFVGDGINDAPVLARADIGIAMGGVGSDAAIEAADMVLMQDNIETIRDAIDISHRTHKTLMQNVVFTLVIKIGVLILTLFGLSNMWMGVFADVGVTLIAILNALRILK